MTASKPTYWTALNIEPGASKQKIVASYRKLAKDHHPDRENGDAALWQLITSAYNVLKNNPQHVWGARGDAAWQRDYIAATKPAPKATPTEWTFEEIEGESKADRRKRYARQRQAHRYATEPDFAAARRESSKKSHAKSAKARRDAKKQTAAA